MYKFEAWWNEIGQESLYALNTLTDSDAKILAKIAWEAALHEQAEQEPVAWANPISLKEFKQRDENIHHRLAAVADRNVDGFITPLYTDPVRTKDLTDDEITQIVREATWGSAINRDGSTSHRIARAVIQEFRRKNGIV